MRFQVGAQRDEHDRQQPLLQGGVELARVLRFLPPFGQLPAELLPAIFVAVAEPFRLALDAGDEELQAVVGADQLPQRFAHSHDDRLIVGGLRAEHFGHPLEGERPQVLLVIGQFLVAGRRVDIAHLVDQVAAMVVVRRVELFLKLRLDGLEQLAARAERDAAVAGQRAAIEPIEPQPEPERLLRVDRVLELVEERPARRGRGSRAIRDRIYRYRAGRWRRRAARRRGRRGIR